MRPHWRPRYWSRRSGMGSWLHSNLTLAIDSPTVERMIEAVVINTKSKDLDPESIATALAASVVLHVDGERKIPLAVKHTDSAEAGDAAIRLNSEVSDLAAAEEESGFLRPFHGFAP